VGTLLQDLRFAVRSLRKQPSFTCIAVACLALGIGANTAIFSVVHTVLLGALPYREPERLVRLFETFTANGKSGLPGSVSVPNLADWRAQSTMFEGLLVYSNTNKNLVADVEPERLRVVETSANAFSLLGTPPLAGRTFRAGEDEAGAAPVIVLSEGFWRRRFAGRRAVLDSTIRLDSTTYTVIGVMPDAFDLPVSAVRIDAWTPLVFAANSDSKNRGSHYLSVIGRLKRGATVDAAYGEMKTITARLLHDYPGEMTGRGVEVTPVTEVVTRSVKPALLLLLGAVGLVLLIACANVANLLLARASGRKREVAIRTALGANPSRIVRQFLTEAVLLALAGGLGGVLVAFGSLRIILRLAANSLPRAEGIALDPVVLAFTAAIAILTGLAFGLAPALHASRADLRQDLSDSTGKASLGAARHRALKGLVVAEIALSLVLFAGAGLLVRSFSSLVHTDAGLDARNVVTFKTRVALAPSPDSSGYVRFYGPVLERVRALPGVRAAGITNMLPIQQFGMNGDMQIIGRPEEKEISKRPFAEFRVVSSDFFKALGITMVRGREFDDHDGPGTLPVMLINEEFARRNFPGEDPIGKQIRAWSPTPYTVVGIAANVRSTGLDQEARPEVYVNAALNPQRLGNMTFVISATRSPSEVAAAARAAVASVSPGQPLYGITSMETVIDESLQGRKLTLVLLVVIASLALVLSAAGIYGVMAYTVTQRTRELGIRVALGASTATVTRMVLNDAATLAAAGVGIGLAGALALGSVMRSMVYGVGTRDPATLAIACFALPAVAILASVVPAARAARADPLVAIRTE